MDQAMVRRLGAEFLGTFILVLGGCGSAVLAGKLFAPVVSNAGATPTVFATGVGLVGIALAFGLTVLGGVYAFGHISGGHFNPAVTVGLATARRFPWKDAIPYIVTQVIAAVAAAGTLWLIAINQKGQTKDALSAGGLGSNGYGDHSPALFNVTAGIVTEVVFTAIFVLVILGITDRQAPKGFAALAIGLTLTMIHLAAIPVTGTSVNPARSTGPALVALVGGETWPVAQLWLFWVAPIVGALVGGVVYGLVAQPVGGAGSEDTPVART
jgi:aquaporin Z